MGISGRLSVSTGKRSFFVLFGASLAMRSTSSSEMDLGDQSPSLPL
jgi:hypothetical protein